MPTRKKTTATTTKPVVPEKPKTVKIRFAIGVDGDRYTVDGGNGVFDTDEEIIDRIRDDFSYSAVIRFVELEIPAPQDVPTLQAVLVG
jgi:hypothetical protein